MTGNAGPTDLLVASNVMRMSMVPQIKSQLVKVINRSIRTQLSIAQSDTETDSKISKILRNDSFLEPPLNILEGKAIKQISNPNPKTTGLCISSVGKPNRPQYKMNNEKADPMIV